MPIIFHSFYNNKTSQKAVMIRNLLSFIFPKHRKSPDSKSDFKNKKIIAIIPTYKPLSITLILVKNLLEWHDNVRVVLVDDSSPELGKHVKVLDKIQDISKENERLSIIRTPQNLLKAGAINYGFTYIKSKNFKSDVIVTCDDDIIINKSTLPTMIKTLFSTDKLGAVCSNVRVKNKNKNLITRLQGLEYNSFNVAKISDNGFFMGPLVMQGAFVAFKSEVFYQSGGFANNLIEDYEFTARIKTYGWEVRLSEKSWVKTEVPESLPELWRQRIRWTYGGLTVLEKYGRSIVPVIQDLLGHGMFLTLLFLVTLSFFTPRTTNPLGHLFIEGLLLLTYIQFSILYLFNIYILKFYKDADWVDRLLRLSIFPEFLYSNFLTLVLLGSYVFFVYNKLFDRWNKWASVQIFYKKGLIIFDKFGYSLSWGTRNKGGGEIDG